MKKTSLGYLTIPVDEKTSAVQSIFDGVASHYDLMNDLMSFGLHRLWKYHAIRYMHLRGGQNVLDLAAGSGDMTAQAIALQPNMICTMADASELMLDTARLRFGSKVKNYHVCTAESLPFTPEQFDRIIIGFGFRNFTDQIQSLKECYRVLTDDGIVGILEFSKPKSVVFRNIYNSYARYGLPKIGEIVCDNPDAYRYLAESIDVHPDAETVSQMLYESGFDDVTCHSFCAGLVRLHVAFKYD